VRLLQNILNSIDCFRLIACRAVMPFLFSVALVAGACTDSDDGGSPATDAPPTASPTPVPRDIPAAEEALEEFARAVAEDRLDDAWHLYAASIPGTTAEHRADRGCDYSVFSFEFPMMRNLFQELSPLQVVETFGSALGVNVVELRVRGANGVEYLATLPRGEPYSVDYQLQFLNSGNPAAVPGMPEPFPSPQYPQGFCGIWTGAR
jgi:hypothetical protein